jgi:hypothetical protein
LLVIAHPEYGAAVATRARAGRHGPVPGASEDVVRPGPASRYTKRQSQIREAAQDCLSYLAHRATNGHTCVPGSPNVPESGWQKALLGMKIA